MCAALQAHGIAPGNLLVLRPSSADPLGSDVVIATPAVRSQFGRRLASVYAPVVIASFGTGDLRIDVRAMAPDGAAAYRAALAADLAARRGAGQRVAAEPAGQRLGGRPERPRRGPGRCPAAADAGRRGQRRAGAGRGVHRLRARGRPGRAAAGGRADRACPGPRRVRPRPRLPRQATRRPAPPRPGPRSGRCSPSCARSARPTGPPGPAIVRGPGGSAAAQRGVRRAQPGRADRGRAADQARPRLTAANDPPGPPFDGAGRSQGRARNGPAPGTRNPLTGRTTTTMTRHAPVTGRHPRRPGRAEDR